MHAPLSEPPKMTEILALQVMVWLEESNGAGPRYDFEWVAMDRTRRKFYSVFHTPTNTLAILDRPPTPLEWEQLRNWLIQNVVLPFGTGSLPQRPPKCIRTRLNDLATAWAERSTATPKPSITWAPVYKERPDGIRPKIMV